VEAVCDRILIINKGRIVADGSPTALRSQVRGERVLRAHIEDGARDIVLQALAAMPEVAQVDPVAGTADRYDVRAAQGADPARAIFHCCVANGWVLTGLHAMETRLEDVFRDLTLN